MRFLKLIFPHEQLSHQLPHGKYNCLRDVKRKCFVTWVVWGRCFYFFHNVVVQSGENKKNNKIKTTLNITRSVQDFAEVFFFFRGNRLESPGSFRGKRVLYAVTRVRRTWTEDGVDRMPEPAETRLCFRKIASLLDFASVSAIAKSWTDRWRIRSERK